MLQEAKLADLTPPQRNTIQTLSFIAVGGSILVLLVACWLGITFHQNLQNDELAYWVLRERLLVQLTFGLVVAAPLLQIIVSLITSDIIHVEQLSLYPVYVLPVWNAILFFFVARCVSLLGVVFSPAKNAVCLSERGYCTTQQGTIPA